MVVTKQVQTAIDGFPKRLICVIEFIGKNVDNQKKGISRGQNISTNPAELLQIPQLTNWIQK